VVVGVVGAAGASAVAKRPDAPTHSRATPKRVAPTIVAAAPDSVTPTAAPSIQLQGAPVNVTPIADSTVHAPPLTAPAAAAAATNAVDSAPPPARLLGPIIPQGRTDLADSMFAVRRGDTVVVTFDTGPARTRRADKFELLVRQTLHSVYGPIADTVLAGVPSRQLAAAKELVTTLPSRGIHLRGPHGPRFALWPKTRPGRNGPLVIAYRTVVER